MATDEERAAIMAEYMKQVNNDDDDEEEFQGDYFDGADDDDDGSDVYGEDNYDDDDDDDDDDDEDVKYKEEEDNYVILQGHLSFNDEGKLVYSGTWSMKNQTNTTANTTTTSSDKADDVDGEHKKKKKKKTKFKLKSKRAMKGDNSTGTATDVFDLSNPLATDGKPISILFDGFFTTDETDTIEPYRKIKERDVTLTFAVSPDNGPDANGTDNIKVKKYVVNGKGCNDFGTFTINGIYDPTAKAESNAEDAESYSLICNKKYVRADDESKQNKKRRRDYDSEEDYDFDGDEGADFNELIGLHEEADLSVEELRKRYYGNGSADNNDSEPKRVKKLPDDEDDDDGCGF